MAAEQLNVAILSELMGSYSLRNLRFRLWNEAYWPDEDPRPATLILNQPDSLRKMLLKGSEVALAEAYLRNDFDVEGDLEAAFELAEILRAHTEGWVRKLKVANQLRRLPHNGAAKDDLEHHARLAGARHSLDRDREAIQFHYDLSNDFYALWLDSRLVYSCAYFEHQDDDLEKAQQNKLDYICRKLRLKPGQRLLDIGCGWGGLILHAAMYYGVKAVGITLSDRQAEHVQELIRQRNLQDRVEVRIQDYRRLEEEAEYDAVVSVGMVEHVGRKKLPDYFTLAGRVLKSGGVFLNHGIGLGPVSMLHEGPSFIEQYVFPDGELVSLADMLQPAEAAGFEIRDVENLREHYTLTLRHWVKRLEAGHDEALMFVSEAVYRIWRLYMTGSAYSFKVGYLAIYQTLLVKLDGKGCAKFPLTRASLYQPGPAAPKAP